VYDQTIAAALAESRFPEDGVLGEHVSAVLRLALTRTPYLAGAPTRVLNPHTTGDLAAVFDYLIPRLIDGAEKARRTAEDLDHLRDDVAAVRRVLGVSQ
jgi:hypothetical protein